MRLLPFLVIKKRKARVHKILHLNTDGKKKNKTILFAFRIKCIPNSIP